MRFEAREIKPYVEPVKAAELVLGRPYFRVALDFDEALECLMHCSMRHRDWDGTLRPSVGPSGD
jgi:hypothetical protein